MKPNKERIQSKHKDATAKDIEKKSRNTKIEVWVAFGLMVIGILSMVSITDMFGINTYIAKCKADAVIKEKDEKRKQDLAKIQATYGKAVIIIYTTELNRRNTLFVINLATGTVSNETIGARKLERFSKTKIGFGFSFDWLHHSWRECTFIRYVANENRSYFITELDEAIYIDGEWKP